LGWGTAFALSKKPSVLVDGVVTKPYKGEIK